MSDSKPPSMKDFDYFATPSAPVAGEPSEPLGDALEDAIARHQKEQRRLRRAVLLTTALLVVLSWFVWSYRDQVRYAFSAPRPPQRLGDVVDMSPRDVPHNAYVELTGITEHRGLAQKLVRGVVPVREEFWYFRLVGSRGVFIEVPPDKERYQFATRVTVRGRAVDPDRATVYRQLLDEYEARYHPKRRDEIRIIQVGVEPGQGRLPFVVVFGLLWLVALVNIVTVVRFVRRRRARPLVDLRA